MRQFENHELDPEIVAELAAGASETEPAHRACSTPVEAALAAIIGGVLGVESVNGDDDFFALGGDSVLATQTVARIRTWLDTPDIVVADIFAARTVAALAGRLTRRERDSGRLEQVAELYLEISRMDGAEVLAESTETASAQ